MEISGKFRQVMRSNNGHNCRYIPRHARVALEETFKENPNFFKELFDKQKTLLIQNYGIPEEVFLTLSGMHHYMTNNFGLFRSCYSSAETNGPFGQISEFVINAYYSFRNTEGFSDLKYKIEHNDIDMLSRAYSMSVLLSHINESEGEGHEGMVSRVKDFKSVDQKSGAYRLTRARFARSFNQQFPGWPEAFVDGLNDVWRDSFGTMDMSKYHVHVGRTAEHFVGAYENTNIASNANITTTVFTKHLSNSCMQYERDDDDAWESNAYNSGLHCVEAYATTDEDLKGLDSKRYFEVMYVTDSEDPFNPSAEIYGRTVFSRKENGFPEFGPFYVTSNLIKEFMLNKIPSLVADLSNADKKAFALEFKGFLSKADSKDCFDYPCIWDGAILRAFTGHGDFLTTKSLMDRDNYTTLVAPYIDVGHKLVRPVFSKENGKVYLSVSAKRDEDKPEWSKVDNVLIEGELGIRSSCFVGHQGVNSLHPIKTRKPCDCCGDKHFSLRSIPDEGMVCNTCLANRFVRCGLTDRYIRKSNAHKKNYVSFTYPDEEALLNRAMTRLTGGSSEFFACVSTERMCYMDVHENIYVGDDADYVPIDSVIADARFGRGLEVFKDTIIHRNYTGALIDIDGNSYIKYDRRIAWDVLNDKLYIDEDDESVLVNTVSGFTGFSFRVHQSFVDKMKEDGYMDIQQGHRFRHNNFDDLKAAFSIYRGSSNVENSTENEGETA